VTFLPIAERELRLASRKRSTFGLRIAAALVALLIGCSFFALNSFRWFGGGTATIGPALFAVLTWLALAATLSAGLFFTSDCLSEEKREGTLGFLFLTDLRGYDVVLGKLLSTSLRSFYALLAVFPVIAVTLMMGGVAGGQFWKTMLALVNAMLLSLAGGLFVSSISRDSQKALGAAFLLLVLFAGGGPALDGTMAAVQQRNFNPIGSLSSPAFLFVTAGLWGQSHYWPTFVTNQAIAWLLLGLTCLLLPRTWQERTTKHTVVKENWGYAWKFGSLKKRTALRRKLIALNPVLWLACRERWQAWSLWAVTVVFFAAFTQLFTGTQNSAWWFVWSFLSGALTLIWYLGMASQSSRFFVEAQRSRLIELLLSTPLTSRQIIRGQWDGLFRMFGPPLALCLVLQLAGALLVQHMTWGRMAATTAPPPAATVTRTTNNVVVTTTTKLPSGATTTTVTPAGFQGPPLFVTLATTIAGQLALIGNLAAVAWFAMWTGLNSRNANVATLKTIVFVQIIPWFAISVASTLLISLLFIPTFNRTVAATTSKIWQWYPLLSSTIATTLYLAKDAVFSLWARRKLYSELRERAVGPVQIATPPPLPPVLPIAPASTLVAPT